MTESVEENMEDDLEEISELQSGDIDSNLDNLNDLMQDTQKKEEIKLQNVEHDRSFQPGSVQRPELVDDFIRNFFIRHKLSRSLDTFQIEWYETASKGKIDLDSIGQIPDVYIKNQRLEEQATLRQRELDKAKLDAERAKATWDKLRKERDFHKMHHHRVQQEKEKLNKDIEKLKSLHTVYEQKYQELSTKYEAAMKEKMLVRLERDRLHAKTEALNKTLQTMEDKITRDDNRDMGIADDTDGKKGGKT
jgi:hypothetical protein